MAVPHLCSLLHLYGAASLRQTCHLHQVSLSGAGVRSPPPSLSHFASLWVTSLSTLLVVFSTCQIPTCLHDPTGHNPPPEKSPSLAVSLRTFRSSPNCSSKLASLSALIPSCLYGCLVLNCEFLQDQDCVLNTPFQLWWTPGSHQVPRK